MARMVPAKQKTAEHMAGHHPHVSSCTNTRGARDSICTFNILNKKPLGLQVHS